MQKGKKLWKEVILFLVGYFLLIFLIRLLNKSSSLQSQNYRYLIPFQRKIVKSVCSTCSIGSLSNAQTCHFFFFQLTLHKAIIWPKAAPFQCDVLNKPIFWYALCNIPLLKDTHVSKCRKNNLIIYLSIYLPI